MLVSLSIAGLQLTVQPSARASWNRSMLMSISTQCEGFNVAGEPGDLRVTLRDFVELEEIPIDERLTGTFSVRDGVFVDQARRFGWREAPEHIEFWHDAGLRLSIPYLLQLGLVRTGRSFVHSAAVAYRSRAFIFPAFGGVGKTLLVSQLLSKEGFRLLGDDLCVVSQDGLATSYARPFCLYEHHREALEPIFNRFGVDHVWPNLMGRVTRQLLNAAFIRAGIAVPHNRYRGIKGDYVLVSPIEIYGAEKICTEVLPIGAVVVLRRQPKFDRIRIEECTREEAARFASNVTLHEWKEELPAMLAGAAVNGRKPPHEATCEVLRSAFNSAQRTLTLTLPQKIDIAEYVSVVSDVMSTS